MNKILVPLLILCVVPTFGQDIYINEYLASNDACCTDEHGDYDDFIEIYNGGSASVDIGGMQPTMMGKAFQPVFIYILYEQGS